MTNNTSDFFYVSPTGQAHRGDDPPPPNGSTLLVAPGCAIDDALARRYGVDKQIAGEEVVARSASGEPLVRREGDGRAFAAGVLPDGHEGKEAALEAAEAEDDAGDDADEAEAHAGKSSDEAEPAVEAKKPDAQGKALRLGDVEDKAVHAPSQAKKAPTRPAKGK